MQIYLGIVTINHSPLTENREDRLAMIKKDSGELVT